MKGTYQMVLPSKLAQQGGQGGGDSENYINVSAKADSVFEQIRIIAKKISRTLFFRKNYWRIRMFCKIR